MSSQTIPKNLLDLIQKNKNHSYRLLLLVRDNPELELCTDNGWSWLEYNGVQIEGTGDERFTGQSEIDDILHLAVGDGLKDYIKDKVLEELKEIYQKPDALHSQALSIRIYELTY